MGPVAGGLECVGARCVVAGGSMRGVRGALAEEPPVARGGTEAPTLHLAGFTHRQVDVISVSEFFHASTNATSAACAPGSPRSAMHCHTP